MCLINHQIPPVNRLEVSCVFQGELVSGKNNMTSPLLLPFTFTSTLVGGVAIELVLADDLSTLLVADIYHTIQPRAPLCKLSLPGMHGGERNNKEEWSTNISLKIEIRQKRDTLNCLT